MSHPYRQQLPCVSWQCAPLSLIQWFRSPGLASEWLGVGFRQRLHDAVIFDVETPWQRNFGVGPETYDGEGAHVWTAASWCGACVTARDALLPRRVARKVFSGSKVNVHGVNAAHGGFQGTLSDFSEGGRRYVRAIARSIPRARGLRLIPRHFFGSLGGRKSVEYAGDADIKCLHGPGVPENLPLSNFSDARTFLCAHLFLLVLFTRVCRCGSL